MKENSKPDEKSQKHHPYYYSLYQNFHHLRRVTTASATNKPFAYLALLLLVYALGYISAACTTATPPPKTIIVQRIIPPPTQSDFANFLVTAKCAPPIHHGNIRRTILDKVYNSTSPYDNFPPKHVQTLLRPQRIRGWGSNGAVFENLIRKVKPRTIIEVGTFLGASAINMAEISRSLGLETQILCLDDFRGWPGFRDQFKDMETVNGDVVLMYQFMQNVVNMSFSESILAVPFSTGSGLQKLCEWGVTGDLIEVDAGHDFNSAWSDITRAYRLLSPGGVIFGHDYFTAADNRGVRRAVNLFAKVNGLRVRADGQHWVLESKD